jgi:hypothetical protein
VKDVVRLTSRPGSGGSSGSDIRYLRGGAALALGEEIGSYRVFNAAVERVCKRTNISPAEVRGGVLILRGKPPPR